MSADTRRKLVALVSAGRELMAKATDIFQEIDTLCDGGATIGDQLKAFQRTWQTAWGARYGGTYLFTFSKDVPAMKRLLKAVRSDDLHARVVTYLSDNDPFYAKARHSFHLFAMNPNRWAKDLGDLPETLLPPVGCTHTPACRSDQEHTRRRQSEMRA